jgi:hypothetical protein
MSRIVILRCKVYNYVCPHWQLLLQALILFLVFKGWQKFTARYWKNSERCLSVFLLGYIISLSSISLLSSHLRPGLPSCSFFFRVSDRNLISVSHLTLIGTCLASFVLINVCSVRGLEVTSCGRHCCRVRLAMGYDKLMCDNWTAAH